MRQVQKNSIISYVLSDQVWWCNIKRFFSYSKNSISKFMEANLWYPKLFHFHLPFWIWEVWKGNEKLQKFKYLKNEKGFLNEMKKFFHSFRRPLIWWKNKNLIKNSRYKLSFRILQNIFKAPILKSIRKAASDNVHETQKS